MTLSLLTSILLLQGAIAPQGGAVTGTLRMRDGLPAAGVRIAVMAPPGAGRGAPQGAGTLVIQGEADSSGKYRLEDVPPGRYYVVAGKLDAPTFYPGVREFATAKVVEVGAKLTVDAVDFVVDSISQVSPPQAPSLVAPSVIAVKGRIVLKGDLASPPPAGIIFDVAVPSGRAVAAVSVAPDGTFTLPLNPGDQLVSLVGLPDGYTLASIASGAKDVRSQPLHVALGTELVVTLNAEARPRFRVLGRVIEDTTERALAGEQVELVHPSGETARATVNSQGMFTFSNLFHGSYVLRAVSPRLDVPDKKFVISDSSVQVELRARKKP